MKSTAWLLLVAMAGTAFAQDKPTVSIIDLRAGEGVSQGEALILTDILLSEIQNTGVFRVVNRSERDVRLKEMAYQMSGACDYATCIVEVGREIGVTKMIAGSVGRLGQSWTTVVQLVDVETGLTEISVNKMQQGSVEELARVMADIAAEFSGTATRETDLTREILRRVRPGTNETVNEAIHENASSILSCDIDRIVVVNSSVVSTDNHYDHQYMFDGSYGPRPYGGVRYPDGTVAGMWRKKYFYGALDPPDRGPTDEAKVFGKDCEVFRTPVSDVEISLANGDLRVGTSKVFEGDVWWALAEPTGRFLAFSNDYGRGKQRCYLMDLESLRYRLLGSGRYPRFVVEGGRYFVLVYEWNDERETTYRLELGCSD